MMLILEIAAIACGILATLVIFWLAFWQLRRLGEDARQIANQIWLGLYVLILSISLMAGLGDDQTIVRSLLSTAICTLSVLGLVDVAVSYKKLKAPKQPSS